MEEDEAVKRRVIETPAFPGEPGGYRGMTLRDYFAAKAMQAVIVNIVVAKTADGEYLRNVDDVADLAYKQAEAMLKAKVRVRDEAKATASESGAA